MDITSKATVKQITWNFETPPGTDIKFQFRSANTMIGLNTKTFLGPDGNENTFYTTSGVTIWSGHYNERWVQYKALLSTNDDSISPILQNITI